MIYHDTTIFIFYQAVGDSAMLMQLCSGFWLDMSYPKWKNIQCKSMNAWNMHGLHLADLEKDLEQQQLQSCSGF
jgi:hypothetical protein